MSPRVREVFTRAAVLPPGDERESYLAEACGSDAELRLEVQRLLVDAELADSFFGGEGDTTVQAWEAPTIQDTVADNGHGSRAGGGFSESAGDVIGPYTLLRPIGEGGMGTVWEAQQHEPIQRKVALKVVKAGMDTREVLARFEAERQALALMDHPGIAKVLDAGATPAGRPYFAMELVDGVPLNAYCQGHGLGTRERLELFRNVCSAINHAHQKGIIHRDLKPSNVLVAEDEGQPVPKVIDFGIAKATEEKLTESTLQTVVGQLLGTPAYMSPEQAGRENLDIDTRSDIYSLGVLLYELLAGRPPFDPKTLVSVGYEEMRRIIREEDPPKPSTRISALGQEERTSLAHSTGLQTERLSKTLRGDLDWIVMKALEKERDRRYETANAFAADIGRYLNNEAVLAAAPTAGYRFRKFARRNQVALGAAATIALVLVAATAFSVWQAAEANAARLQSEKDKEDALAARLQSDKDKEEALAAQAEERAAREEAEGISRFLTGMFESTRPGEEKGGRGVLVRDILDQAVEKLDTELADQPERKAKLRATLGRTYHSLGHFQKAIGLLEEVLAQWREVLGPEHRETLSVMNSLAASYYSSGRTDDALEMWEEALELNRKAFGLEHPDTQAVLSNLALSYKVADRMEEALEMQEEVLRYLRKWVGPEDLQTLTATTNLANSYRDAGRMGEAREMLEEVLKLSRKLSGPEHPGTIGAMVDLAVCYRSVGRMEEALEMQEEVLRLSRKVLGPEHSATLAAMQNMAICYNLAGRVDEALEISEEGLELNRKVLGPEHPVTLLAMQSLAAAYHSADRMEEALEMHQEVLRLSTKVFGPEHPETLGGMQNVALSYQYVGRMAEAREMFEDLLKLRRKILGPKHPHTALAAANLGNAYAAEGSDPEKAIEAWQEALRIDPLQIKVHYQLGKLLADRDRHEEALPHLEFACLFSRSGSPDHTEKVERLRETLVALGREEEARNRPAAEFDAGTPDDPAAGHPAEASGQEGAMKLPAAELDNGVPDDPPAGRRAEVTWQEAPGDDVDSHSLMRRLAVSAWKGESEVLDDAFRIHLQRMQSSENAEEIERFAKSICLLPGLGDDVYLPIRELAETALELAKDQVDSRYLGYFRMTLGMAHFRCGDCARALKLFEEAASRATGPVVRTSAFFVMMCQANDGRAGLAKSDFRRFEGRMPALPADDADPLREGDITDDLISWIAYREAARLLDLPVKRQQPAATIVPPDATWKWLHLVDGTDPAAADPDFHTSFARLEFDDSSWSEGQDSPGASGGFGYGDSGFTGVDIGTPEGAAGEELGQSKAAYFRHRFTTDKEFSGLELRCQRDDGIIVYLDGEEVARNNMSDGEARYDLPAARAIATNEEPVVVHVPLQGVVLPAGDHVLGISVHNPVGPSSDLRIGEITLVEVSSGREEEAK